MSEYFRVLHNEDADHLALFGQCGPGGLRGVCLTGMEEENKRILNSSRALDEKCPLAEKEVGE